MEDAGYICSSAWAVWGEVCWFVIRWNRGKWIKYIVLFLKDAPS